MAWSDKAREAALQARRLHAVGDRVQRNPKIWKKIAPEHAYGNIIAYKPGADNNGRMVHGYLFVSDRDKGGVLNHFTGKKQKSKGTWFTESELVKIKKKK